MSQLFKDTPSVGYWVLFSSPVLIRPSGTTLGSSWPCSTTDTESREAEVYVARGHEGSVMACYCVDSSLLLVSQSLLLSTSIGSFL